VNPVKAIFGVNTAFKRFEKPGLEGVWLCKVVYVLCQLLALAAGVWKVTVSPFTVMVPSSGCCMP